MLESSSPHEHAEQVSRRRLVIWLVLGSILVINGLFTWAYFGASSEQLRGVGFALFHSSARESVGNWWFLADFLIAVVLLISGIVAWRRLRRRRTPV